MCAACGISTWKVSLPSLTPTTSATSSFSRTFTGNAFGDFLEGSPTTLFFAVSSPDVGGTAWQYSLFGQDEYQVNSRLTLSYGLRWQILPGFHEDGGNLANFDQRNNSIVVPDSLAAYLAQQNIQASNLAFQQSFNACNLGYTALPCTNYVTASQDHLPQSLRNTYKRNFQPRVSIAYRPVQRYEDSHPRRLRRLHDDQPRPLSFNNSGNPTSALHTYTNSLTADGTPLIQFPNTAPPTVGVQYGGGGLDQGVDPNYRDPQANQWNLTVERQLSEQRQPARQLRRHAHLPAEHYRRPEPDSGEHHAVSDDRRKSIRRSACALSQLVHALQHLQRRRSELRRA